MLNWDALSTAEFAAGYFLALFALYWITCGGAYLLVWRVLTPHLLQRKLQPRRPRRRDLLREILASHLSIAVFTLIATPLWALHRHGFGRLYTDVTVYGWGWFFVSILLMVLLHDTWFYWAHRLLHHPRTYRFHRLHHRSITPTPWAVYAFGPAEAAVQAAIVPIIFFTVPAHPWAVALFLVHQHMYNLHGHLGFNLLPSPLLKRRFTLRHNTPDHHDLHHRLNRGNFGLYFNLWDRALGTNVDGYDAAVARTAAEPVWRARP